MFDSRLLPPLGELQALQYPRLEAALAPVTDRLTDVIRELQASSKAFPHQCCELAADRVEQLGLGLEYVHGLFRIDGMGHGHAWNFHPDLGLYFDITARQFLPSVPDILIVPVTSDFAQRHYHRDWLIAY